MKGPTDQAYAIPLLIIKHPQPRFYLHAIVQSPILKAKKKLPTLIHSALLTSRCLVRNTVFRCYF